MARHAAPTRQGRETFEEWEHEAVPASARRGLRSVGEVLVGFVSAALGYVALVALAPGLTRSSGARLVTEGDAP